MADPPSSYFLPLGWLGQWSPFRIDALGLVTMIGADEVNAAVGRLLRSRYTEYLPILGAFVIAGDHFARAVPGFTLYNIDKGITTTDLAGWFARFLRARKMKQSITTLRFTVHAKNLPRARMDDLIAGASGVVVAVVIFVVAVLEWDWWGFANALSMLASVFVRSFLVGQNRAALDRAAKAAYEKGSEEVRVLCLLPDGKMLTARAPNEVVVRCFIHKPKPPDPRYYKLVRLAGWFFFAAHVITIGQASLLVQILSVLVLCGATVLLACDVGTQGDRIGSRITVEPDPLDELKPLAFPKDHEHGNLDRRQNAYVFLEAKEAEIESMVSWGLAPHRTNTSWWAEFDGKAREWPRVKERLHIQSAQNSWKTQKSTSISQQLARVLDRDLEKEANPSPKKAEAAKRPSRTSTGEASASESSGKGRPGG